MKTHWCSVGKQNCSWKEAQHFENELIGNQTIEPARLCHVALQVIIIACYGGIQELEVIEGST